jgi:TBC1 domain family member 4
MKHFQLELYQMSRLIKDALPDVHDLLDKNEVAITLYASSWMLTLFSSSFELGFVTRIFDLLLFASSEVTFRVIISLLEFHREEILKLESFEDIMDYMKNVIPKIDAQTMTKVLKKVYDLKITRQLLDYKIEYSVLKDELINTTQHIENLKSAKEEIRNLEKQLDSIQTNVERVEKIGQSQELENQAMKLQVQRLGDFITSLSLTHPEIEIPTDVRRLIQQLEYQQNKSHTHLKRRPVDRKSLSLSNNLGMNLKVLIEQNENDNQTPPCAVTPTLESTAPRKRYFDKTFEQIKHHQNQINSKFVPRDSTERPKLIEQASIDETVFEEELEVQSTPIDTPHPLCCNDVNFQFNTIQLKSINTTSAFKKSLE